MTFAKSFDNARTAAVTRNDLAPLIACVPYATYLGLHAGPEPGTLHLPFAPKLVGSPVLPALHGGVVAAFMELTAQLAVLLVLDEPRMPKVVDFSIDYLRSARTVDSFASAHVERLGSRVAQVQVRCWQAEIEKPVAIARAHFLLAGPPA
jgi:uncharacterized protein (TIGR00369 family)